MGICSSDGCVGEERPLVRGEDECHLRVASYNVRRCFGRDGVLDPGRVLRTVEATGARIVGLQEVDTHAPPAASNILDLAVASGFTVIRGPTLLRDGVDYGNALLARCPVVEIRRHDLSVAGREPRGAIDARLDVGGVALRVVVTHFGLRRAERRLQVKKLLAALEAGAAEPTTLLGDLNEWLPGSRSLRPLERWFGRQLPAPRTFPAGRPVLALDRIWTRPAGALAAVRAFRGGDARVASDHLPLVAAVARVSLRPAERR